jgi:hypothetical protein
MANPNVVVMMCRHRPVYWQYRRAEELTGFELI